jgi:hypothetical protein
MSTHKCTNTLQQSFTGARFILSRAGMALERIKALEEGIPLSDLTQATRTAGKGVWHRIKVSGLVRFWVQGCWCVKGGGGEFTIGGLR